MNAEQESNIQKIIAAGGSFVLISDEKTPEESLLAKEALLATLKNKGVKTYNMPGSSRSAIFDRWLTILPPFEETSLVYSTSILIPKSKMSLKELSYAEENGYVIININSTSDKVRKEDIVFKHNPIKTDAAFCFLSHGKTSLDEGLHEELSQKITLPEKENIFFIEKSPESVAVKTFEIMKSVDVSGSYEETKAPSLLLASLLVETNNLSGDLRAENLDLASALIKMRADKHTVRSILTKEDSQPFNRLFGRALARMTINEPLRSVWTFLSSADFEKSGVEEDDYPTIGKIITRLGGIASSQKALFLIWQDKRDNVYAAIHSKDSGESSAMLSARLAAEDRGGLLISGPYKNFSEAEIKIKDVLKETI